MNKIIKSGISRGTNTAWSLADREDGGLDLTYSYKWEPFSMSDASKLQYYSIKGFYRDECSFILALSDKNSNCSLLKLAPHENEGNSDMEFRIMTVSTFDFSIILKAFCNPDE